MRPPYLSVQMPKGTRISEPDKYQRHDERGREGDQDQSGRLGQSEFRHRHQEVRAEATQGGRGDTPEQVERTRCQQGPEHRRSAEPAP